MTLTFDRWPWPFEWTSRLSMVITENFRMIRWQEHCQKGVTDGQTDRNKCSQSCLVAAKNHKGPIGFAGPGTQALDLSEPCPWHLISIYFHLMEVLHIASFMPAFHTCTDRNDVTNGIIKWNPGPLMDDSKAPPWKQQVTHLSPGKQHAPTQVNVGSGNAWVSGAI